MTGSLANARRLAAGIGAGVVLLFATAALAGECPAGKAGTNALNGALTEGKGVTDTVLSSIDLAHSPLKVNDRLFRLRRLVIEPGGIVPLHNHGDRPALIYVISGSIYEYNSECTVPILHSAGEVAQESIGLIHWWKNTSNVPTVLIAADLLHTTKDDGHTM